ncbi:hypothetical protein GCM10009765_77720 [Fodinicola feengrottensis]|uniref:DUF4760 domain-containing protein n=1 Tax=Fodinicola feengrottensis TaxID=435914 RepID=A0ABP4V4X5_9ACTN
MEWNAILPPLVGAATGALLNGLISTCVALLVVFKSRNNARELAKESAAIAAAEAIAVALAPVVEIFSTYHYKRSTDWAPAAADRLREFRRVLFVKLAAISDDSMRTHISRTEESCARVMTRVPDHPVQRTRYVRVVGDSFSRLSDDLYAWRLYRTAPDTADLVASLESGSQTILEEEPPRLAAGPMGGLPARG